MPELTWGSSANEAALLGNTPQPRTSDPIVQKPAKHLPISLMDRTGVQELLREAQNALQHGMMNQLDKLHGASTALISDLRSGFPSNTGSGAADGSTTMPPGQKP